MQSSSQNLISALLLLGMIALAVAWVIGPERGSGEEAVVTVGNAEANAHEARVRHPVTIRKPDGAPVLQTDELDAMGKPVFVACSTCHTVREPDTTVRSAEVLDEFHQGLTFKHGDMSCLTCHNRDDYDTLRMADGTAVSYPNVMNLCAQCHGTQARDYNNGAHGGMTGHWDLTRGPRQRNSCIDCHDAHAPKYPTLSPVFRPRDRFLRSPDGSQTRSNHE